METISDRCSIGSILWMRRLRARSAGSLRITQRTQSACQGIRSANDAGRAHAWQCGPCWLSFSADANDQGPRPRSACVPHLPTITVDQHRGGLFRLDGAPLSQTGDGGGAEGNRTPDLLIANEALSQLSYSPIAGLGVPDKFCQERRLHEAPLMIGAPCEVKYLSELHRADNVSHTSPDAGRPRMCRRCHNA